MKRFASLCAAVLGAFVSSTPAQHLHLPGYHGRGHTQERPADVTIPGFEFGGVRSIGPFDAYATLSNGTRVVFDGQDVDLLADDGTLLMNLGSTPGFVFTSFVRADPTETFALVGESSNGGIYKVSLSGGGMSLLANLGNNFDAVFEDATHAVVSAAPCGFFCGSEIDRLDVNSGALTRVASLVGPSGGLAKAQNGDIYYAIQPASYPPPPGEWGVVRWTQAQLTSGIVQTEATATTFVLGLDGGSSIAIDAVYGHLFVSEAFFSGGTRIVEFDTSGAPVATVIESDNYVSTLEILYGPGPGSLQAFQPANGATLKFRSTDFNAFTARIFTLRPSRPVATTSGPGLTGPGLVTLEVTGARPLSTIHVVSSPIGSYNSIESAHDLGAFLFVTGMPIDGISHVATVPTNLAGTGTYTFNNPGGLEATLVFQALIADSPAHYIGSSTAAFN